MNFKKMAEQKIDELSGKIVPEKVVEDNYVDIVLEGLDEDSYLEENIEENIEIEIDSDDDFSKTIEDDNLQIVEDLFDGYLGETSEVPNPLDYGPNATYRNLREGIVYKKGPDNLWEVFLKDGQTGKQGMAGGSGVGVNEVKKIIEENTITDAYPKNGFSYYPEIESYFGNKIVALWDFSEDTGEAKVSKVGYPYVLKDGGTTQSPKISGGPLSNYANTFDANKFLRLEGALVGDLNLAKDGNEVSIIAIARHTSTAGAQCVAGMWQETSVDARRQYALFVSLSTYGGSDQICGHISVSGGPSPKVLTSGVLPYSRDYASNVTKIELSAWTYETMTYDGQSIKVYIDGKFEPRLTYTEPSAPNGEGLTYSKNPYVYTSGLNRVTAPATFSVGANRLSAAWANNLFGDVACVAIFNKALTQKEVVDFQRLVQGRSRPNINYSYYHNSYLTGERGVNNIGWYSYYGSTALSGNNTFSWYLAFPTSGTVHYLEKKASSQQSICYDDQNFGITLSTIDKLTVDTNNANTVDVVRFAIKSNNTWYISNTSFTQTVSGISGTNWTNVETKTLSSVSSETWLPVTLVPGSTFTIGTGVVLPQNSIVDAIGIYSPATSDFVRIRNLAIW
jgi:hypothetical protein